MASRGIDAGRIPFGVHPYGCTECPREFLSPEALGAHIYEHDRPALPAFEDLLEKAANQPEPDVHPEYPRACEKCHRPCRSARGYRVHIQWHRRQAVNPKPPNGKRSPLIVRHIAQAKREREKLAARVAPLVERLSELDVTIKAMELKAKETA